MENLILFFTFISFYKYININFALIYIQIGLNITYFILRIFLKMFSDIFETLNHFKYFIFLNY